MAAEAIGAGNVRRYFGGAPAIVASCSKLQCVSAAGRPETSRRARTSSETASVPKSAVSMQRASVRSRRVRAAS
jgi:hypothetical protein